MNRRNFLKSVGGIAAVAILAKTKSDSPHAEKPDYTYANGLSSNLRTFHADGTMTEEEENIPSIELHPFDATSPLARNIEEIKRGVADDLSQFKTTPTKGGVLEYAAVNTKNPHGKITLVTPAWGVTFRDPNAIRDMQALVANNTAMPFLVFHAPGVGGSSPLSTALSKEMGETGRYRDLGEHLLDGLTKGPLKDYDCMDLIGNSQGARHAIGMAAAAQSPTYTCPIDDVRVFDPVCSRERGFVEFLETFMVEEGGHQGRYKLASQDRVSAETQESMGIFIDKIKALIEKNGVGNIYRDLKSLCEAGLHQDIQDAVPQIHKRFLINSPELSGLSDPREISLALEKAARLSPRPQLIQQRVLAKRTHACTTANPGVLAVMESPRGM